jgi:poly-gamma-glutamate synthesis protein (capsule biosynthesis protein)
MVLLCASCSAGRVRGPRAEPATAASATAASKTGASTTAASTTVTTSSGPPGAVTFAFAGDTQFPDQLDTEAGAVSSGTDLADQLRGDPTHILDPVRGVLSGADLALVNLETAITERGSPDPGKNFHFRSPALTFGALRAAGIDVVNMANNHALDYGPVGMQDTFSAIASAGLSVIGIGHNAAQAYRPFRTTINGERIAVFGADDWLEPALVPAWSATDTQAGVAMAMDRTRLLSAVQQARPTTDTVIVFMHWGVETTHCASPEQEELAKSLIAAGADIIVGSHAHRVFGAGYVGSALVAYGLGNFVYWREDGESGRSGILLVTATGRRIDNYSWVPARISHGIPQLQTGTAAAADLAEWAHRRNCSGLTP